ncbi:MAG: formate dehydrogenase accessory sulfurtransferase FdhD [Firmicutes bacterium]|nr:formate dehydrogenase accessory sulfurtransferase FdhD [Bacillota bacterium]
MEPINTLDILRWRNGQWSREKDIIIREHAFSLYLNGRKLNTMLATPEHLDELALGYLKAEGYLASAADLEGLEVEANGDWVRVNLRPELLAQAQEGRRKFPGDRDDGDSVFYRLRDAQGLSPVTSDLTISPATISLLATELEEYSWLFQKTGGVHGAALADEKGKITLFREDIGRHNAIDKVVGRCLLEALDCQNKIFLTSGRVSFDTMVKTIKLGVPVVLSISAPTTMAVQMARRSRVTLVGFARGKRFNVYSGEGRLGI